MHSKSTAIAAATALLARLVLAQDLQTFGGDLGGLMAPSITFSGNENRPFRVDGMDFEDFGTASELTCNIQFNACADVARGVAEEEDFGGEEGDVVEIATCGEQRDECLAAQASAPVTSFDDVEEDVDEDEGEEELEDDEEEDEDEDELEEEGDAEEDIAEPELPEEDVGAGAAGQTGENIGPDPLFPEFDLFCDEL